MIATVKSNKKALSFALAVIVALVLIVPFGLPAAANHPTGTTSPTCLDVNPETDTNPVGTVHTVTATLRAPGAPSTPGDAPCDEDDTAKQATGGTVRISFEITGVNDTDGDTPETPDKNCLILTNSSSCVMEYLGNITGDDFIRGWIDHDGLTPGQGGVTEADRFEETNELTDPGTGCTGMPTNESTPEPDCTDVVEKEWQHAEPDRLDCDDASGPDTERETNPHAAGGQSNETYTCRVFDAFGNQTVDTEVTVQGEHKDGINDPENPDSVSYNSPDYQCVTADQDSEVSSTRLRGGCRVTVTQADGELATTQICFWIESFTFDGNAVNNDGQTLCTNEVTEENQISDGSDTANDDADQVEKTWEVRRAASVDAEPETDTNSTGANHQIHAFVFDQFGSQFQGNTTVKFEFFSGSPTDNDGNTPNSPDRTCTTNNSNTCSITYSSANPGTDLVCVWVGDTAPNMQGNQTNGTCDGEGLNDPDDESSQANPPTGDAPEPSNDDQDVVQKTWQNPNAATRLDCQPETDSNPSGTSHTVSCTARNQSNSTVSQAQIDVEATGSNDPDNGDSPQSPDFSCTTGSDGVCSFTHGSGGTGSTSQSGVTTYRAWIDSDNNNNSTEADPDEGRNEGAEPGQRGEPDDTDVVEKTWTGGPPPSSQARTIDCTPDNATNNVGANHVVTCTVRNASGQPVQGESVTFTESGPGTVSPTSATTDQSGQARTTATSNETGNQTITGTITADTQGTEPGDVDECDRAAGDPAGAPAGSCADTVNKTWQASQARSIDCEPETGTNQTGTNHVVTCTVRNAQGQPAAGEGVTFTESGPGTVSPTQATTNSSGQATTTATSTEGGTQSITGTITADTQGAEPGEVDDCDRAANDPSGAQAGVCADTVEKVWEAPDTQCSDGIDNDGDGRIDFPDDPGCQSAEDNSESEPRACRNRGSNENVIVGTSGADVLNGTSGRDVICGAGGNDVISGRGGADLIVGNGGDDTISGGGGRDNVSGNAGNDNVSGNRGNDAVKGNGGNDSLTGRAGIDTLTGGGGKDNLQGGNHDDILKGGDGNDTLRGGKGDDALDGGLGRDQCFGNAGRDLVRRCE